MGFRMDAGILRARIRAGRRDFAGARTILEETIAGAPQAVWPRVVLSEVLLQQGADLPAAEHALRSVLQLDPNHPEATRNLAVLLQHRGQATGG